MKNGLLAAVSWNKGNMSGDSANIYGTLCGMRIYNYVCQEEKIWDQHELGSSWLSKEEVIYGSWFWSQLCLLNISVLQFNVVIQVHQDFFIGGNLSYSCLSQFSVSSSIDCSVIIFLQVIWHSCIMFTSFFFSCSRVGVSIHL